MEIQEWLKNHPEVKHWVAIDDLDMDLKLKMRGDADWGLNNFVLTSRQMILILIIVFLH